MRLKTELVKGIVDHFNLNCNLVVGYFLLLIDIILVMKNFFDVGIKLVNFVGELLHFQIGRLPSCHGLSNQNERSHNIDIHLNSCLAS